MRDERSEISRTHPSLIRRLLSFILQPLLIVSTGLFSWLVMMIVHELGHALHAWLSGGRVIRMVLHPLTISRTDVSVNPHPLFVAWGGPVWGCLLPVTVWLVTQRWEPRYNYLAAFFAGFCLIANGGYLGAGVWFPVGDAHLLIALGTPAWVLGVFGLITLPMGLWLWHGLGPDFGLGRTAHRVDPRAAVGMSLAVIVIVFLELALSDPR